MTHADAVPAGGEEGLRGPAGKVYNSHPRILHECRCLSFVYSRPIRRWPAPYPNPSFRSNSAILASVWRLLRTNCNGTSVNVTYSLIRSSMSNRFSR